MLQFFASLAEGGASSLWLPAAGLLSAMAAGAAVHFRMLYRRSEEEQKNQRDLVENLHEGVYRSSLDGRQLSANRALVRLNGYESEAEMLASVGDIAKEWYVVPSRRTEFRRLLSRDGVVRDFVSEVHRHKTRERIWVSESARLVRDRKTGKPLFYEGSVREITETVTRLQAEERLSKLSSQIPGGLIQFVRHTDGSYTVPYMSSGFRALYGLSEDEDFLSPQEITAMVHPDDRQAFLDNARSGHRPDASWDQEYRVTLRDGTTRWLQINAKPEVIDSGVMWHGYISDITARKTTETEIEKLAFFDPLTGLPNRRMFMDRMARAVARCRERETSGAVLFIDLDNFKALNDTRGHDVGDTFLIQVAERLKGCVGPADTVARIGGRSSPATRCCRRCARIFASAGAATAPRRASASWCSTRTTPAPTRSSSAPTSPCTGSRRRAATAWRSTTITRWAPSPSATSCWTISSGRSPTTRWSCTSSRRWTRAGAWSAPRRCAAGPIRSSACCCPTASCR